MKLDDPMLALLYHQYREAHRQTHGRPHSPPVTGALALLGIVVTFVALAGLLAIFFTLCSIFAG